MTLGKTIRATVLAAIFCCAAANALAATLYWDPTGTLSSSGNGSGAWDTNTTANWWISGSSDTTWTDTTGTDMAVFGGTAGAYTVTVAGNDTANAITFNATGYTLTGGALTLAGTTPTITANAAATINSAISVSGTGGLTKVGSGALTLGNTSNSYSGPTIIGTSATQGGAVILGANNALPVGTNLTIDNRKSHTASLNLGAYNQTIGNLTMYAGGAIATAITSSGGTLALSGNVTLIDAHTSGQDWRLTINAPIDLNGATRTFSVGYGANNDSSDLGDLVLNGVISTSSGTAGVTIAPWTSYNGSVTFGAANTYNGPTTLQGTTTLALNANNAIPNNSAFVQGAGTILDLTAWGKSTGVSTGMGSLTGAGTIKLGSAGVLTIGYDNTSPAPYAGVISGSGSIDKTGAGTLTLTGSNTYTGATTVNGGILSFGPSALGAGLLTLSGTSGLQWYGNNNLDITQTSGGLQIADNSQVTLDTNGNNVTLNGSLSIGGSAGSLIKAGPGPLVLNGTVSYSGSTTIAGGSLLFGPSTSFVPAPRSIKLTGGALQVAGPYTTVMGWLNSKTIDPTSTGALALTQASDSGENINMAGYPTLSLGAASGSIVNYTGTLTPASPGTWYLGGGGGQITFANLRLTGAASAVLGSGDRGGSGTVAFPDSADPSQTNTYTGATTIAGGLVVAPVLANGGQPSTIGSSSSNAANLILNGGGIQYTGPGASTNRAFSLGIYGGVLDASGAGPLQWTNTTTIGFTGGSGPRTLTLQGSDMTDTNTLALTISDSGGPTSLVVSGLATWLPTAANTYTGPTTLAGGTLVVPTITNGGVPSEIGASSNSPANLVFNGGTFQYTGTAGTSDRGFTLNAGGGTFDIEGQMLTLTGSVTSIGLGAGLTKVGSGTLVLAGPMSSYGPTTLNMGNLVLAGSISSYNATGGSTTVNGGTLTLATNLNTYLNSPLTINGGAVVQIQGGSTLNLNVAQNGSVGSTNVTGAGTLQLVGTGGSRANPQLYFGPDHSANAYWGAAMNVATLDLGNSQCYIDANTGHNSVGEYYSSTYTDARISSNIIGSGGITFYAGSQYGSQYAELLLSASNNFTGPVEVDRGAIFLDNASALSASNSVTLSNSDSTYSRLFLLGNNTTISNLQSAGTTPTFTGVANGNPSMSGPSSVKNAVTLTVNQTANTTFAGTIADSLDDNYSGGSNHPGPLSINLAGGAMLTLTGSNTYSGSTTVSGGILSVAMLVNGGSASSIGASTNNSSNLFLAGGTLQYTGSGASTDRLFSLDAAGGAIDASGTGPLNWTNAGTIGFGSTPAPSGTRTLTLTGNNTGLNTMGVTLADDPSGIPTAVVKTGVGTWVMTASNTYTGPTTVQQGTLQFNTGSSLQGRLVVNGGSAITSDTFAAASATVQQGILQVNGGNTLQGPLAVSGGTAVVNNSSSLAATTTTVSQGLLQLVGGSSLNSPLTLSGGTLSLNNPYAAGASQTANIGAAFSLTSASALNFQAGTTWNPITTSNPLGTPLLSVSGALTANSTAKINLASYGSFTVGDNYPLIALYGGNFGGTSGTSGLVLNSLPAGVEGTLNTTTATVNGSLVRMLDIDITSFDTVSWTGTVNQLWDTTTKNWQLVNNGVPTGTATTYLQGAPVTFDNTGSGGTVNIASAVQPGLVTVNNMSYTFSGTGGIQGTALLAKKGSGNLTLLTNNSYSGGTSITGGTLTLGDGVTPGAGSITGDVSLDNTATGSAVLLFKRPDTLSFAGNISGNGSLVQAGPGTLIVTGSNSYIGSTTVSGGSLQIGNGGASGSIPGDIVNNGTVIFNRSDSVTLINTISGSGTTYVNGGNLQLGDGATMGSVTGPLVTNATLAFDPPSALTYSGVINGSGGIALVGTNALTLSGVNNYAGATTINGNYLTIASAANLGSLTSPANLVFNSGTLEYAGSTSTTAAHGLTVGANGATVQVDNPAVTLALTGSVSGAGGLTIPGPGALAIGGPGNPIMLNGPTTVNGGTLTLAGNMNTYMNSPLTVNAGAVVQIEGGATLNLNVVQNGSQGSTNVTGAGTLQLVGTGGSRANPQIYFGPDHSNNAYWGAAMDVATLDLGNSQCYINANTGHNAVAEYYSSTYTDARISSNIIGSGGITFYAGSQFNGQYAELLLSASNSFTGPVEVDRGAIFLDNALALTASNAVTISNSDGTYSHFFLLGNNATISNLQSAGTTPASTGVANGNTAMKAPSTVNNPVTLTVNETANTSFGGTIADALNDGYDGGSVQPGPLTLDKTGSATLVLSGINSYSGGTEVDAGTLIFANATSIPSGSSLTVGAGASSLITFPASSPAPIVSAQSGAAAVPEPSTIALLGAAAILCGIGWRRRSTSRSAGHA
jgi:fibronectin-binding autotransporter adhesin